MRKFIAIFFAAGAMAATGLPVVGATVLIDYGRGGRLGVAAPTCEVCGGTPWPPGTRIYEFVVTADSDILSIADVSVDIDQPLYNNPFGSNMAPPDPQLAAVFPNLAADSWITTPGQTSLLGGDLGDDRITFVDATDDGPVATFLFARLTTASPAGRFRGVFLLAGTAGVERFPFNRPFGVPAPTSLWLGSLALLCTATRTRLVLPGPPHCR